MKNFFYFLTALVIALATAFLLRNWLSEHNDPGYVLIGIGHWSLETSLAVFTAALVVGFFVFYMFFRLLGWLFRLPGKLKQKGREIKFNRSQEALISGLVDSAEGNWERAEKVLIKHAAGSGAPLIHYLTAAKAAHSRGAVEKRDEYFKIAKESAPGSEIAIGLAQAELQLSEKQFDQALKSLTHLQSINPTHASVLKLLHLTYEHLGDWEGIRKLIPSLHQNKVLMEAEVKLLEAQTYSALLKEAAARKDGKEIQELWDSIPAHVQKMQGMQPIYFAAMIEAEAGAAVEQDIVEALSQEWNDTLLVLYGSLQSIDFPGQLRTAEKWLELHPRDAVLLRVAGKICINCGEHEKAEQYLSKSIEIDPTVTAYQMLGDLLFKRGDKDRAS
ncbi:MAG: heme biosynthesis HemY N-terminal domain-containing protein, partial [Gammaproteobacteria bacterium]